MEPTKDNAATSLTAGDVETWLDDNVDWLCDYLQRRKSIVGCQSPASQSRHTVPAQCRDEPALSAWHSRTQTIEVDAVSENVSLKSTTPRTTSSSRHLRHQPHQVQRGATLPSSDLFTTPPDSKERRSSLMTTSETSANTHNNSKKHLRRHFARSRMQITEDEFSVLGSEASSASFDWFVSTALVSRPVFCIILNIHLMSAAAGKN